MSRRDGLIATNLLKIAGAAAVLGASEMLFREPAAGGGGDVPGERPADDRRSRRNDLVTYGVGYGLALLMTVAAFALVHWGWASGSMALGIVFALALAQAIVHVRCFLHIDLKRSARDDLQLLLFSSLIIALMVGGTLVVLFNLRMRMM